MKSKRTSQDPETPARQPSREEPLCIKAGRPGKYVTKRESLPMSSSICIGPLPISLTAQSLGPNSKRTLNTGENEELYKIGNVHPMAKL